MNLVRFNTAPGRTSIFDELFSDFFGTEMSDVRQKQCCYSEPLVNILEETDKFRMELTVPGIKKEDIKIDVEKDQLLVSANIEDEQTNEGDNYTYKEFYYGNFSKRFYIPETVDKDQINASFENGILKIDLVKKEEAIDKGPKHIEIK